MHAGPVGLFAIPNYKMCSNFAGTVFNMFILSRILYVSKDFVNNEKRWKHRLLFNFD